MFTQNALQKHKYRKHLCKAALIDKQHPEFGSLNLEKTVFRENSSWQT
jgi:hypothetical protein